MKKLSLLALILLVGNLFAQQSTLDISFENITENNSNWETNLSFSATNAIQTGILIGIPQGLRVVPLNVWINEKNIWLQYSDQVPQRDSVLTWHNNAEGLVILFGQDFLSSGDQIQISFMSTLIKKQLTTEELIEIRAVTQSSDPVQISDQIFASGNIPVTLSK
jgi:hypothetical protein